MPGNPSAAVTAVNDEVVAGVGEQIRDLQPTIASQVGMDAVVQELNNLATALGGSPTDQVSIILTRVIALLSAIQAGTKTLTDIGPALGDLDTLKQLAVNDPTGLSASVVASVTAQLNTLLNYRPDVDAIMGDLQAMQNLRGGPADATAFHDYNVLQVAFKDVWMHAFSGFVSGAAAQLYDQVIQAYNDSGITPPPAADSLDDINDLNNFMATAQSVVAQLSQQPVPLNVQMAFPEVVPYWSQLSDAQRFTITQLAPNGLFSFATQADRDQADSIIQQIGQAPAGPVAAITNLITELSAALSEPYAFDLFAPNAYNFGLLLTYRQQWEPLTYQAGDLVATIPLAPGETRRYSKKSVVKKSRAQIEIEKSMSSHSQQSSQVSRAETAIMQKATTATNFQMTARGSFNVGIGSMESTTSFGANQSTESASNKKDFHEATLKAAEEYRLERSLQVDTASSKEEDDTSSGEISNPNNEITVTYLFYELQRQYSISESIYRARPVILVAQEVPAPDDVNEAWLIEHQWIIARVLLDDSFRPALQYLTSGLAGDDASLAILKSQWESQAALTSSLESQVNTQLTMRDSLRQVLVQTALNEDLAKAESTPTVVKVLTFDLAPDPGQVDASVLDANRKALNTRLQYVEEALADAQDKLHQASDAFQQATKVYAAAMEAHFTRDVAVSQLRIHVKQNIIYYMQAIWDTEVPDQRFFRLYNLPVICPAPDPACSMPVTARFEGEVHFGGTATLDFYDVCAPNLGGGVGGETHYLHELADLDTPLGYKGNYIIFPLKDPCYLTTFMLNDFIDQYGNLQDPDDIANFNIDQFDAQWKAAGTDQSLLGPLRQQLSDYLTAQERTTDVIVVPTGQLFIEALPGSHPLLEDFKLLHRIEDVRKVKAEVRHAELENLRLASRLVAAQDKPKYLEDPDIESKIVVEGSAAVLVSPKP